MHHKHPEGGDRILFMNNSQLQTASGTCLLLANVYWVNRGDFRVGPVFTVPGGILSGSVCDYTAYPPGAWIGWLRVTFPFRL